MKHQPDMGADCPHCQEQAKVNKMYAPKPDPNADHEADRYERNVLGL